MPNAKDLEVKTSDFSIALIGPYGSGKSSFCKTAPKPAFLLNIGNEEQSYRGEDVDYVTIPNTPLGWQKLQRTMTELDTKKPHPKNPVMENPEKVYKSYILDNASALLDLAMTRSLQMNPSPEGPKWEIHYGPQYNMAEGVLRKFLELEGQVLVCFHIEIMEDKNSGAITHEIYWGGKGRTKIPGLFDEVLFAVAKNAGGGKIEYLLQTGTKGLNKARSRISGTEGRLPLFIPNRWEYLVGDKEYKPVVKK